MVEAGQRVQKPGAEPGGAAGHRVRQRRLGDERQQSRNGHSEGGPTCDSFHRFVSGLLSRGGVVPALRAAWRGEGRVVKPAQTKAPPRFVQYHTTAYCWTCPGMLPFRTRKHNKGRDR